MGQKHLLGHGKPFSLYPWPAEIKADCLLERVAVGKVDEAHAHHQDQ